MPRSTLEHDDASQVRIEKIYRLIGSSAFGIHDVSRTEPDAENQLPRFNMPLEKRFDGFSVDGTKFLKVLMIGFLISVWRNDTDSRRHVRMQWLP